MCDNCPDNSNPGQENTDQDTLGNACDLDDDNDDLEDSMDNCPLVPNPNQDDSCPPEGNGIGDACECESDFDCDGDVDGTDATTFKLYFGRNLLFYPCDEINPCRGDFDCDQDCDGTDAALFKQDFGRSGFYNPCPVCVVGEWCLYDIGGCEEDCQTELDECLVGCEEWPPDSRYICNDNCVFDYHYNCIPACENG